MTIIETRHSYFFVESNPDAWTVLDRGLVQDILLNHFVAQRDKAGQDYDARAVLEVYEGEDNHGLLLHLARGDGQIELAERSGAIRYNGTDAAP
jgi:hypothetical protein